MTIPITIMLVNKYNILLEGISITGTILKKEDSTSGRI